MKMKDDKDEDKCIICEEPPIGIIFPMDSGIRFTRQCGGHACHQEAVEGVYAPITPYKATLFEDELDTHFIDIPGKYQGWCCYGIDEETAQWLDQLLVKYADKHGRFTVNRDRLKESKEAWIHLYFERENHFQKCILTWSNSD